MRISDCMSKLVYYCCDNINQFNSVLLKTNIYVYFYSKDTNIFIEGFMLKHLIT